MATTMSAKPDPNIPHRVSPPNENDYDHQQSNQIHDKSNGPMSLSMPARPPPRPFKRANLSLEQNPFEVSFSQSATSVTSTSPSSNNASKQLPNPNQNPAAADAPSSKSGSTDAQARNGNNDVVGSDAAAQPAAGANPTKTSPKPTLPPLSAIAEGTREGAAGFPWGFSAALNDPGSLRSGPLSPAMLPGPRQESQSQNPGASNPPAGGTSHGYFDAPSLSFRTGLTPGIGRTGLTPLVGGPASFPPPSPNTAAFLAMVTNAPANAAAAQAVNQLTAGATITPNTLSALTGTILQQANAAGAAAEAQQASQQQHPPHPLSVSHTYQPNGPPQYQNGSGDGYGGHPTASYANNAQTAANAAANGLFLLSQAHQELTKREEQQAAEAAAAAASAGAPAATRGAAARKGSTATVAAAAVPVAAPAQGHNKRKSGEVQGGRAAGGKRARGSTGTTLVGGQSVSPVQPTRQSSRRRKSEVTYGGPEVASPEDDDESLDEDDMLEGAAQVAAQNASGAAGAGGRTNTKKFETEEEKRKNFLERNRQAALKCRQRKKAWLTQLQQQVEYLKQENERLQGTIVSMRDEVTRLSAVVVAHRACGLGGVVVPGYVDPGAPRKPTDSSGSPVSPVVSVAPVSVPVNVPQQSSAANAGAAGYGY